MKQLFLIAVLTINAALSIAQGYPKKEPLKEDISFNSDGPYRICCQSMSFFQANFDSSEYYKTYCFIDTNSTQINGLKYFPFALSYLNENTGYIRKSGDSIIFLSKNYNKKNNCDKEQLICNFNAKIGESWETTCSGALAFCKITYSGSYYDIIIKDTLYVYNVEQKVTTGHTLDLVQFKASKKYGFIEFTRQLHYSNNPELYYWTKTYYMPIKIE